jgi:4-hydroxybenzoyl-CoA reductase subunit beta
MLRLPPFRYFAPGDLAEAVATKAEWGRRASYVAGGTDLLPKMKRRQEEPEVLIQLGSLPSMGEIRELENGGWRIGAGVKMSRLATHGTVLDHLPALAAAAGQVANPVIRNMATLGGNLCLDTRCSYFDQSLQWREAIEFCLKKDGDACRVAGSSQRCWAIQASDTAPLMMALDAEFELVGPSTKRTVSAASFYLDDGIRHLSKQPDELLTSVHVPAPRHGRAAFVKVSRRLSFDFSLLSVAAWIRREDPRGPVQEARLVLGAIGSAPILVEDASEILCGRQLDAESMEAAAEAAVRRARPLDNADHGASWRRNVVRPFVIRALAELEGSTEGRR